MNRNLIKHRRHTAELCKSSYNRVLLPSQRTGVLSRHQATSPTEPTNFSAPSRPRPIHPRPLPIRELPQSTNRVAWIFGAALLGLSGWGAFLLYATNLERLSSSVTRQVITNLKQSEQIQDVLGAPVQLPPVFLLGDPWISGSVNMPAGHVDLSFRVQGSKTQGTVYFTSVRKDKGLPFTILRFKVITDNGETIHLVEERKRSA